MTRSSGQGARQRVDDLVAALLTASRVLVGVSAASLASVEETVTLTQFRALVVLEGSGETPGSDGPEASNGMNLNGLADRLGVNPSTAMRTVDRLVTAGLVSRWDNPANRRQVVLRLTASGEQVVQQVTDRRRAELARIVSRMSPERRADLVTALTDFAEAAGERPADGLTAPLGW